MEAHDVQFIDTPLLRVAYEISGPSQTSTSPVILLHGWPDDARTWDRVVKGLSDDGLTMIRPWLRGCGGTNFQDARTMRSGQVVAFAQDVIDVMDALGISRASIVGHDWGARTAYVLAALFPQRIKTIITCSASYETGIKSGDQIDPAQARAYWYQWFWHTERGREALAQNRRKIGKLLWQTWSPGMSFTEAEFAATATAWENPDWVACTLHSYRVRWGAAERDARYDELERKLAQHPKINVPTILLHGKDDGATLIDSSAGKEDDFTNFYDRRVLPGVGHFIPREDPDAIIQAVRRLARQDG